MSTDMICGHERQTLQWALRVQALIDRGLPAIVAGMSKDQAAALYDISDPAIVAEMLASEGRRLGVSMYVDTSDSDSDAPPNWRESWCILSDSRIHDEPALALFAPLSRKDVVYCALPRARALLATWLQLPDGNRENAEKALRGAT